MPATTGDAASGIPRRVGDNATPGNQTVVDSAPNNRRSRRVCDSLHWDSGGRHKSPPRGRKRPDWWLVTRAATTMDAPIARPPNGRSITATKIFVCTEIARERFRPKRPIAPTMRDCRIGVPRAKPDTRTDDEWRRVRFR
ncbi:unnamed protein product, partial [Iphiclides podalirius]